MDKFDYTKVFKRNVYFDNNSKLNDCYILRKFYIECQLF